MCFRITMNTKHLIAKEDIEVYKTGTAIGANFETSMHKAFLYLRDTLQPTIKLRPYNNMIEEGYYSYDLFSASYMIAMYNEAKPDYSGFTHKFKNQMKGKDVHLGKFIIPKGAEVFIRQSVEAKKTFTTIVSNQLIFKEQVQWV